MRLTCRSASRRLRCLRTVDHRNPAGTRRSITELARVRPTHHQGADTMRDLHPSLSALTIAIGIAATSLPAHAQFSAPCAQIRAACEQAGFVQGAARDGYGLQIDCIRPIVQGIPQRPRANMPLPQIDPQLVAACRERNANFGGPRPPAPYMAAQPQGPGPLSRPGQLSGPGQMSGLSQPSGSDQPCGPSQSSTRDQPPTLPQASSPPASAPQTPAASPDNVTR
jgi:hypothetical protein